MVTKAEQNLIDYIDRVIEGRAKDADYILIGENDVMKAPGIKAKHAIVTPTCRANKTDLGAAEEAVYRLVDEYMKLTKLPVNEQAQLHFVLSVERPRKDTP